MAMAMNWIMSILERTGKYLVFFQDGNWQIATDTLIAFIKAKYRISNRYFKILKKFSYTPLKNC